MPVSNPIAIKFCNETIRPLAEQLAFAYYDARRVLDAWNATGASTLFPAGGGAVQDNAASDGRPPITADDVLALIARLTDLTADYEANTRAKLNSVLKPSVRIK